MFFTFPEDARWNAERQVVEFGVEIGEYQGVVRVPRRLFQRLLTERPTPERCVEAYHLQRTRFERIAERKLRRRLLTEDGNVEIPGAICGRVLARGVNGRGRGDDDSLREGRRRGGAAFRVRISASNVRLAFGGASLGSRRASPGISSGTAAW
jgi:hypothetical protein